MYLLFFSLMLFSAFFIYLALSDLNRNQGNVTNRLFFLAVLSLILMACFLFFVSLADRLMGKPLNYGTFTSAGLAIAVGFYFFSSPAYLWRRLNNRTFFKKTYNLSAAIAEIIEVLTRNSDQDSLLTESLKIIRRYIEPKEVAMTLRKNNRTYGQEGIISPVNQKIDFCKLEILAKEKKSFFDAESLPSAIKKIEQKRGMRKKIEALRMLLDRERRQGTEMSVLIRSRYSTIGLLELTKKRSGGSYEEKDRLLLKIFAFQAALVLEQIRLDDEAKKYLKYPANLAVKRTAKIKHRQEEQRQMMVEIAHGLQTPLTIIKSEISGLVSAGVDPLKLNSLDASINRISKFIYEMLRLVNLESESNKIKFTAFNLSELLRELSESFQIIAEDKGIIIKQAIKSGIYIKGDKGRIEEMVSNLVSNSVKYMKKNDKKIILIVLKSNKKKRVELRIEDTGEGMSPEDQNRLFTRFFRGQNRSVEGTGLGLAISQRVAVMHGGKIRAESKLGQGTKMIVSLPLFDI